MIRNTRKDDSANHPFWFGEQAVWQQNGWFTEQPRQACSPTQKGWFGESSFLVRWTSRLVAEWMIHRTKKAGSPNQKGWFAEPAFLIRWSRSFLATIRIFSRHVTRAETWLTVYRSPYIRMLCQLVPDFRGENLFINSDATLLMMECYVNERACKSSIGNPTIHVLFGIT